MDIPELSIRIACGFLTLLVLTRIMGRKELTQMTFFNFVSGIAIGSIAAALVVNSTVSIRNGVLALVGWTIFTLIMDFLDIKSKKARTFLEGTPRVVIKDGQIMEGELRKARLDIDALNALLRQKNVFSIADVEYAIFETDGKLSVMKKETKQTVTKSDMKIQTSQSNTFPIATQVVSDGQVLKNNLDKLNLDENWLKQQLGSYGVQNFSEVFYAEVQKDGSLYVDKKDDMLH